MRLFPRDLKAFEVFKPIEATDNEGSIYNTFAEEPDFTFRGNIQPLSNNNSNKDYGFELKYAYVIYTTEGAEIKELYKVSSGGIDYEVRAIERWNSYIKLIVKELVAYE